MFTQKYSNPLNDSYSPSKVKLICRYINVICVFPNSWTFELILVINNSIHISNYLNCMNLMNGLLLYGRPICGLGVSAKWLGPSTFGLPWILYNNLQVNCCFYNIFYNLASSSTCAVVSERGSGQQIASWWGQSLQIVSLWERMQVTEDTWRQTWSCTTLTGQHGAGR